MEFINHIRLKRIKNIIISSLLFSFLIFFITCNKRKDCFGIVDNSYIGFGFFIFDNHKSSSRNYEVKFFPVCIKDTNSIKDLKLFNKRNINFFRGFSFHCNQRDTNSFIREIFTNSSKINFCNTTDSFLSARYITPVYIKLELFAKDLMYSNWNDYLYFNISDTIIVDYQATSELANEMFKIHDMRVIKLHHQNQD